MDCESCGAGLRGPTDDFRCRGCGKHVCQTCVTVFDHFGDGEHGTGDPSDRVEKLHAERNDLRQILRDAVRDKLYSGRVNGLAWKERIDAALERTL